VTNPHHTWAGMIIMVSEVIFAGLDGSVCTVWWEAQNSQSHRPVGAETTVGALQRLASTNQHLACLLFLAHPSTNATQW
jgi:hypothetical protein